MAHLLPEIVRQGRRGPAAAAGAILGAIAVIVTGLTAFAPTNCGPIDIGAALTGITYVCGNITPPDAQLGGISYPGLREIHTISLAAILVGALIGGAIGAWLRNEPES